MAQSLLPPPPPSAVRLSVCVLLKRLRAKSLHVELSLITLRRPPAGSLLLEQRLQQPRS